MPMWSPPFDPKHNAAVEALLTRLSTPAWHQTWWGQMAIAVISGVAGGLIVALLT